MKSSEMLYTLAIVTGGSALLGMFGNILYHMAKWSPFAAVVYGLCIAALALGGIADVLAKRGK